MLLWNRLYIQVFTGGLLVCFMLQSNTTKINLTQLDRSKKMFENNYVDYQQDKKWAQKHVFLYASQSTI